MNKLIKYLLFFVLFATLGFSREFLFVNINNQLYKLYYGHSNLAVPNSLKFISHISYTSLYYSKYFLTIFYYLAYFMTSFFAVKMLCNSNYFYRWIIYIYILLIVFGVISMAYNYLANNSLGGDEYTFSRWLMGIAQSPLVAFFIIASEKLYHKLKTQQ